ncbi:sensor histidine kinase [Undibacterium terreum]|uniref:Signal transduction histidine kinase n=1 Tax=Undibacterium terreum TaxID=1224302 RepID=A0A916USM9_9BURK|nr:histidine kinase [Undibacterium terreum]GGC84778.1 hypothetical protein GCM10011396_35130 [Undibacterium terreum]
MKRITNNLIGAVGLFAWSAIVATGLVSLLTAGPKVFPFILTPLSLAMEALWAFFASTNAETGTQKFWAYVSLYVLLAATFAWTFWRRTSAPVPENSPWGALLLCAQLFIALAVETQLLVIVAVELAFVLKHRQAVLWLLAQLGGYALLQLPDILGIGRLPPLDLVGDLQQLCMSMVWMAVSFGVGYLASIEREGRLRLAISHAELLATQKLLRDTLRMSERTRISRNLHDAIGHHLSALNLHLELGLRHAGDSAHSSFHISRSLAQSLLTEIRGVVSAEREEHFIDLRRSLDILCSGVPTPRISLHYDDAISIGDPEIAHALFRCIQEAITNVIRHSGASDAEVNMTMQEQGIAANISDNGKGMPETKEGNGLKGMRSRIEGLRGTLDIANHPSRGLAINIWLPTGVAK